MAENQTPIPVKQWLSVVLIGAFNPRIFHPIWFKREELISEEEKAASLHEAKETGPLVTPDMSRCEIGDEITLECLTDRLSINAATTLGEERLRRLAAGILGKLPHTPITAVGINHSQVFDARDELEWHQIGDFLVPKEQLWNKVMEGRPGMSVVRVEDYRPGPPAVRVWATIEPVRKHRGAFQVAIHTNWHTDIPEDPTGDTHQAELAADFLANQWETAIEFGRRVATELFKEVRKSH